MNRLRKLLVATGSFYLAIFPVGITHVLFCLGFLMILVKIFIRRVDSCVLWLFVFLFFIFFELIRGSDWKPMINNLTSMMIYPIVIELFRKSRYLEIKNSTILFIKWSVRILVLECIVRYILSFFFPLADGFYRFKFYSFMFMDTNFCGLTLLVVTFLIKYLIIYQQEKSLTKHYFLLVIMIFLTISRAAIFAYIVGEFLFYGITFKSVNKVYFRIIILAIIGIVFGFALYNILLQDGSFLTKLDIFQRVENAKYQIMKNVILGAGYGKGSMILEIYPHNSIILYFLEIGLLGCLLKIVYLLYVFKQSRWCNLIVFLPYFVASQSATGYGVHFLYIAFALVSLLERSIKHKPNRMFNETIFTYENTSCYSRIS